MVSCCHSLVWSVIAIDDTDEEEEGDSKLSKRKSDTSEWSQERVKQPKNDENALETSGSNVCRDASSAKKASSSPPPPPPPPSSNGKKLDVISSNVCVRNGSEATHAHAAKSAHYLEMMYRDWGVRASDVEEALPPTKSKARSESMKIAIKHMSLSSFTNADPETFLDLNEDSGLKINITGKLRPSP